MFELIDKYIGMRMGIDLSTTVPGRTVVLETPLRLRREESYGYIRALWWIWLTDGRTVLSVLPGAGGAVQTISETVQSSEGLFDPVLGEKLQRAVNPLLAAAGLKETDRVIEDVQFGCDRSILRPHSDGDCQRLFSEDIPPTKGLKLPIHCFPDGVVFGVLADGAVVSTAYAHRTGVMEDQVADLAVGTASAYRRWGYARTAVSALVEHFAQNGGEALYSTSPDNVASIATALSVGFVPYAKTLILSSPCSG